MAVASTELRNYSARCDVRFEIQKELGRILGGTQHTNVLRHDCAECCGPSVVVSRPLLFAPLFYIDDSQEANPVASSLRNVVVVKLRQ